MMDGLHSVLSFLFSFHFRSGKVGEERRRNIIHASFLPSVSAPLMGGRADDMRSIHSGDSRLPKSTGGFLVYPGLPV